MMADAHAKDSDSDSKLRARRFDECVSPVDLNALPRLKRPRSYLPANMPRAARRSVARNRSVSCKQQDVHSDIPDQDMQECGDGHDGEDLDNMHDIQYATGESQLLDIPEIYVQLLLEMDAISPCDESLTKFLVNDFDCKNHSIKIEKYMMVSRKSICFGGIWKWAYFCSCDPARSQVLRCASVHVQQSAGDMLNDFPACVHIDCLQRVLVDVDANIGITAHQQNQGFKVEQWRKEQTWFNTCKNHNYSARQVDALEIPTPFEDIWPVCGNAHAAAIVTDKEFAVVDVVGNSLRCLSCRSNDCRHVIQIKEALEQGIDLPVFLADIVALLQSSVNNKRKANTGMVFSRKTIPFKLDQNLQKMIAKPVPERYGLSTSSAINLVAVQEGTCSRCHSAWSDTVSLKGQYPIFTLQNIYQASVYYRKCSSAGCDAVLQYDGLSHCLFHMNAYLIDHSVLRQYMHQFLYGRSSLFGFYSVWGEMQKDAGNVAFASSFHYNKLAWAWYGFLHLLDINYEEHFLCSESTCGRNPETIICDATHLAIRKDLSHWKESVERTKSSHQSAQQSRRQSIFVSDPDTRKLLRRFSKSSESCPFSSEDFVALLDGCERHQSSLLPLLNALSEDGNLPAPPAVYRPLLQALSSTSPVCGLVHPEKKLLEVVEKMTTGFSPRRDLNTMAILTNMCPLLADLVESGDALPAFLIPILRELHRLALAPFEQVPSSESSSPTKANVESHSSKRCFAEMWFWPHFSQQRLRPCYSVDLAKSTRSSCRKNSKNYGRMTPGIFAAFCPHGICYGFEMMNQFESPNVPFTLFFTRFVSPPKMIIYDNACHLHAYCLNREPKMFQNTKFLIDRLHWPNHTACSVGYKLDGYPQHKAINSQVAEQMNSSLQRIKVQLSYMGQNNFLWHCRFFLWGKNVKKQGGLP